MEEEIVKAAIAEFGEKGIRFTMDDLAARLRISKRTLYEAVPSKEGVVSRAIDLVFADIKEQEREICADDRLDIVEKIKRVVCLLPRNFAAIDYDKIYEIHRFYPELYRQIEDRLAGEWETTLSLFRQAIAAGTIRPVNVHVVRQMILGTWKNFFDAPFLNAHGLTFDQALQDMMDILFDGIVVRNPASGGESAWRNPAK